MTTSTMFGKRQSGVDRLIELLVQYIGDDKATMRVLEAHVATCSKDKAEIKQALKDQDAQVDVRHAENRSQLDKMWGLLKWVCGLIIIAILALVGNLVVIQINDAKTIAADHVQMKADHLRNPYRP